MEPSWKCPAQEGKPHQWQYNEAGVRVWGTCVFCGLRSSLDLIQQTWWEEDE